MKETPTEERTEERDQSAATYLSTTIESTSAPESANASEPANISPPLPLDNQPSADSQPPQSKAPGNGTQGSAHGNEIHGNGHPKVTTPLKQREYQAANAPATYDDYRPPTIPQPAPSPARPVTAPRPPTRGRAKHKRRVYTRREKILICSLLAVALLATLPIGAVGLLRLLNPQQTQTGYVYPVLTNEIGANPVVLDPERREGLFIDQMIDHMSLAEELGQMIMVEWDEGGVINNNLQQMLVNQHVGGIILYTFNGNIQNRAQVTGLTAAIQAHAKIPLLISIDQEGGNVNRLDPITGPRPSARSIGATNNPNVAYKQGVSDGQILKQLGINDNLAPDVDVQSLSDGVFNASTMVGFEYRMYGTTPDKVAAFAGSYLNGLQDQGVIGTLKHWPGLGADIVDPHDALPTLQKSQAALNSIDFAPYRTLLAQGNVDMIMSTHELVPSYDKTMPATLSPILINQVLRNQLGYQGVVITDGLYMQAISQHWSLTQAAVLAVEAGNDILLGPYNIQGTQSVLDALHAAVSSGQINKARIDLSLQRILALKIKYGMIKIPANFKP